MSSALRETGKYSITLELIARYTDSNRILGVNKFSKGRTMKAVKKEVFAKCIGRKPKEPLKKFHIEAIRFGPRCLDDDNFHAMLKPYIDGLKLAGVIMNDSWKYLRPHNMTRDQESGHGVERIRITVREE
jgi:hypothetical protein